MHLVEQAQFHQHAWYLNAILVGQSAGDVEGTESEVEIAMGYAMNEGPHQSLAADDCTVDGIPLVIQDLIQILDSIGNHPVAGVIMQHHSCKHRNEFVDLSISGSTTLRLGS